MCYIGVTWVGTRSQPLLHHPLLHLVAIDAETVQCPSHQTTVQVWTPAKGKPNGGVLATEVLHGCYSV